MHEIGIIQSILETVDREARRAEAHAVHEVRLRVGRLTGVVADSLQYAFEALREGTLADGASLVIQEVPAVWWCSRCQREFEMAEMLALCPDCGQPSTDLRRGRELELASLEVS